LKKVETISATGVVLLNLVIPSVNLDEMQTHLTYEKQNSSSPDMLFCEKMFKCHLTAWDDVPSIRYFTETLNFA
jgi:hypothetical protein